MRWEWAPSLQDNPAWSWWHSRQNERGSDRFDQFALNLLRRNESKFSCVAGPVRIFKSGQRHCQIGLNFGALTISIEKLSLIVCTYNLRKKQFSWAVPVWRARVKFNLDAYLIFNLDRQYQKMLLAKSLEKLFVPDAFHLCAIRYGNIDKNWFLNLAFGAISREQDNCEDAFQISLTERKLRTRKSQ